MKKLGIDYITTIGGRYVALDPTLLLDIPGIHKQEERQGNFSLVAEDGDSILWCFVNALGEHGGSVVSSYSSYGKSDPSVVMTMISMAHGVEFVREDAPDYIPLIEGAWPITQELFEIREE